MNTLIDRLRERLVLPLPGHDEFIEISGYNRPDTDHARAQEPPPRESAVLVLLYPIAGILHTVLMLRPTYAGVHSAQVSFPGGKHEPQDPSLESTALREFIEETGARVDRVDILGTLSPVYIPPSRMLVTPYVAFAEHIGPWVPDPVEVARLIEVPLSELVREDILKRKEQFIHTMGCHVEIPYFDLAGEVVWGATALMIAELRVLLGTAMDPELGH